MKMRAQKAVHLFHTLLVSEVLERNMHQDAPKTLCDAHSIMFGQHPNLLAHLVADVQNDMSDLLANVLTQN